MHEILCFVYEFICFYRSTPYPSILKIDKINSIVYFFVYFCKNYLAFLFYIYLFFDFIYFIHFNPFITYIFHFKHTHTYINYFMTISFSEFSLQCFLYNAASLWSLIYIYTSIINLKNLNFHLVSLEVEVFQFFNFLILYTLYILNIFFTYIFHFKHIHTYLHICIILWTYFLQ